MAKSFTKDEVAEKISAAETKGSEKGQKQASKSAIAQINAEIARVKDSDLGKAEKKAAIASLKATAAAIKSPI